MYQKSQHEFQNLMKNQIAVTCSSIKNFNITIQKLQIDEKTSFENLLQIDNIFFYQAQLNTLEICENLLESYPFLELNHILSIKYYSHPNNNSKRFEELFKRNFPSIN